MKRTIKILSIEEAKEKIAVNLIKEDFFMDALKNRVHLPKSW